MKPEYVGLLSLLVLFGAIFIGFPIAFTLIAVALGIGYLALGDLALHLMTLQFFSVMRDPTLAAVPFFLFMGYLLVQSGLMERLFRGVQLMLASLNGSLYLAVLITATIFAAATGIVGSSVTLLGVMAAPAMKRSGYDVRMSAGTIAAGGTLGILIPPSVMLIVMGPVVGVPTTDLFAAAIMPGLLLSGMYIAYTLVRSYLNPKLGPPLPMEDRRPFAYVVKEVTLGILPVVIVTMATLGVILAGIVDGVFTGDPLVDASARLIRDVTPASFPQIESQLRGSHGVDVTGGMIAKVRSMIALVQREPTMRVQIISAIQPGLIERVLMQEDSDTGTAIHA